jgi:hypothetical protein
MTYHYSKKITVDNVREEKPAHLTWCLVANKYQVRSDRGGMQCRFDNVETLSEARKLARERAKLCGWAEVFRWAENGTMLKKFHIATYERELSA